MRQSPADTRRCIQCRFWKSALQRSRRRGIEVWEKP